MKLQGHNKFLKSILTLCFSLLVVLTPVSYTLEVQHADACIFGMPCGSELLAIKELQLDGIAFGLARAALSQMTSNIVTWINSGFEGSPMFVTDFGGYLTEVADRAAGDYLALIADGFLCSPFELNVRATLALQIQKSKSSGAQCTFSGVLENFENFATGFSDWSDWFEITTRTANNPYGALLIAQTEASISISNKKGQEIELLRWAEGFLSMKNCEDVAGGSEKCTVVTPGQIIEEQLTFHLSSGPQSLIEADEVNEIVLALFAQLAEQAVTGVNGLLGLSQSNGGSSYLEQMQNNRDGIGVDYGKKNDANQIEAVIESGIEVMNLNEDILATIQEAEDRIPNDCSLTLSAPLALAKNRAEADLVSIANALPVLYDLNARYKVAGPSEQDTLFLEYLNFQSTTDLREGLNPITLAIVLEEVETEIGDFEDEIDDECN